MGLFRSVIADARSAQPARASGDKLSAIAEKTVHGSLGGGLPISHEKKGFGTVPNHPNTMNEPRQSSSSIGHNFASSESFRHGGAGELNTNFLSADHTGFTTGVEGVSHDPSSRGANKSSSGREKTIAPYVAYRSANETLQETATTFPTAGLSKENQLASIPDFQPETTGSDAVRNLDISTHEQDKKAGAISDPDAKALFERTADSEGISGVSSGVLAGSELGMFSPTSEYQDQVSVEADKTDLARSAEEEFSFRSTERTTSARLTAIAIDDLNKKEPYRDAAISLEQTVDKAKTSQPENYLYTDKEWQYSPHSQQHSAAQESAENTASGADQLVANRSRSQQDELSLNNNAHKDSKNLSERKNHSAVEVPVPEFYSRASAFKIDADKALSDIRTQVQSVDAQMLPNQLMSRHADRPIKKSALTDISRAPEVKIGQVDVFVEAAQRPHARGTSPTRPSLSLASRHYLRRF